METDTVRLIGLLALMAVAVLADIRTRKVPNEIVAAGALVGIASGLLPGSIGLAQSLGGLGVGLAMLLPMYLLRATGAGDVKLMACAGAFLGIKATFFATLFAFALGGVLAILYSAVAGNLGQTLSNLKTFLFQAVLRVVGGGIPDSGDMPLSGSRMPYSLAIAGGVGIYVAARFYSTGALG
ncbi:A24 family peptidase [Noviherbaspirillum agri]